MTGRWGIVFVLRTGSPGTSCRWSRLARARPAGGGCATGPGGVWGAARAAACELRAAGDLEGRAPSTARATCARRGPERPRARSTRASGSKHHLIGDAGGIPLADGDRRQPQRHHPAHPAARARPPMRGRRGRPRRRPERLTADRGYDHDRYRRQLREPGITPRDRPPRDRARLRPRPNRWVVERGFAWLHDFKRLHVATNAEHEIHEAFSRRLLPRLLRRLLGSL